MKRICVYIFSLYISLLFFSRQNGIAQTYVNIPDTNFAAYLKSIVPAAMNGNQLDTSNTLVTTKVDSINVENKHILSLGGIQYFKSLSYLVCDGNYLSTLSVLPDSLTYFSCANNNLKAIPALPKSLRSLDCSSNHLINLPLLPDSIRSLICFKNHLTSLPVLPGSLKIIDCSINNLTAIPVLPSRLQTLVCGSNNLSMLPALPNTLQTLNCTTNNLTNLPVLPASLETLACGNNQLVTLPDLPGLLKTLNFESNQLAHMPPLPGLIRNLNCSNNQLTRILVSNLDSLTTLLCAGNQLDSLLGLPSSLKTLDCSSNQLTRLPELPNSLQSLVCSFNQLAYLPMLPALLQNLICESNQLAGLPALPDKLTRFNCENNNLVCFPVFPSSIDYIQISTGNAFNCLPNYIKAMDASTLKYPLCGIHNIHTCPVSKDAVSSIEIPSIFTPNGDNNNDIFIIKGFNLTNFSCKIYDRLGSLIYQWTNINTGWDGKNKNGEYAANGTYHYVITYSDNAGKLITKKGYFQLLNNLR